MMKKSFSSNLSAVIEEDESISKQLKKKIILITSIIIFDLMASIFIIMIDISFQKKPNNLWLHIKMGFYIFFDILILILTCIKNSKVSIISFFIYISIFGITWILEFIFMLLNIDDEGDEDAKYKDSYYEAKLQYITIGIHVIILPTRIFCGVSLYKVYQKIKSLEEFFHIKDHADFLDKLGQQFGADNNENENILDDNINENNKKKHKLIDDEEEDIDEDIDDYNNNDDNGIIVDKKGNKIKSINDNTNEIGRTIL